jgi:hypothetical protein
MIDTCSYVDLSSLHFHVDVNTPKQARVIDFELILPTCSYVDLINLYLNVDINKLIATCLIRVAMSTLVAYIFMST